MMSVVELNRLRHAYVGVPGVSGLSVEQRKRLTMAVELVANPSIVFMVSAGCSVWLYTDPCLLPVSVIHVFALLLLSQCLCL